MKLRPATRIKGRVRLPGDKSISHRAAIIAALARGTSNISNFSTSRDCASTISCLKNLGVSTKGDANKLQVEGVGFDFQVPDQPLDCGNSGSTMRLLAGVLAAQDFSATLIADDSLSSRPMKRIIEPLEMMGAHVQSKSGKPPLRIQGTKTLKAIRYELPVASAQVKSCVLLAGLQAVGRTVVVERLGPSRDHTERLLEWFGVPIEFATAAGDATEIEIHGPARFAARDITIPGDVSSAAFLIAGAALLPGSELEIENVGLNPTRTQFLSLLRSLGLEARISEIRAECHEPLGSIQVSGALSAVARDHANITRVHGASIPQLIDELPLLAVVGTQISGGVEIRDAAELRLKETDRISATVTNLRAMGAEVEEFEDGLAVAGPASLRGSKINSFGDHRIAMAFTIAALVANGQSEISGAECVGVSFPEFFGLLESVVER